MAELRPLFADIALPVPLPDPLTYEVPPNLAPLAREGVRARVRMGKRKLVGIVVRVHSDRPEGMNLRPIDEILDVEPPLPADLLELAQFTAGYYLAPVGEVFRTMLPSDLPPWGDRKVWLTDAGALSPPRGEDEAKVIDALREVGKISVGELQLKVGLQDLSSVLASLSERGRIAGEERNPRSARYVAAVELAPGGLATHLAAAGRSAQGKAVIELLAALGRPATTAEVTAAVECTPAVVRRLISLGILRQFTQVERLTLDRHRLAPRGERQADTAIVLRPDQADALDRLTGVIERREFKPILLQGMTGSGKTEVYLRAAEVALALGRATILLVPEIALVPALAREAERRFGEQLAILHSGLGTGERQQEWERIRRGEARVVLGPRSALFAPVPDLALIVVDEEQDTSYKQEVSPRYHARDLALVRARSAGAAALLVSATPSLESIANVEAGRYRRLHLPARHGGAALPDVRLLDLRETPPERGRFLAPPLVEAIRATFARGEQAMLFLNRRGYAPLTLCRACGHRMQCPNCTAWLVEHRARRILQCHHCGHTIPIPAACPECGAAHSLTPVGPGVERITEEAVALFPDARLLVMASDTLTGPQAAADAAHAIEDRRVDLIIGTQIVAKGWHFPHLTLVGVVDADLGLAGGDLRAAERTVQLLHQVAGRAGRAAAPGIVMLQTFSPEHKVMQALLGGDLETFRDNEAAERRPGHWPPFGRLAAVIVSADSAEAADIAARDLGRAAPSGDGIVVLGPAPAPLSILRGRHRRRLLLRTRREVAVQPLLRALLAGVKVARGVRVDVDVDPVSFL